jgi:hypothetical protein
MSDGIFLSYRRDDASAEARSIYQRLRATFSKDQLFIDVDNIERGKDFRTVLDQNLGGCKVLLAIIGPKWLSASDEDGKRRIDNPEDFVRLEIGKALTGNVTVIPTLVGNAVLPRAEELPTDLRPLAFRQTALIRHESFSQDMDGLVRDIRNVTRSSAPWRKIVLGGAAFLFASVFLYTFWTPVAQIFHQTKNQSPDNTNRDIGAVMARCVKDQPHPEKSEVIQRLLAQLNSGIFKYGWIPKGDQLGTPGVINWKKITKLESTNDELIVSYDWRGGRLRLVPVIQQSYAERSSRAAVVLQGSWSQNNGYGCLEMRFDDDGSAQGRWGVARSDALDADVYLEKGGIAN